MNFIQKLSKVRLLVSDADGVLTDGQLYYTKSGEEIKAFNVRDGEGLKQIKRHGVRTAIISGRSSEALRKRALDLAVDDVHMGVSDKTEILKGILQRTGISAEETLYIGDDVGDVDVLLSAGLSVAVADAHNQAKDSADYVTANCGGAGAVREICDLIISAEAPSSAAKRPSEARRYRTNQPTNQPTKLTPKP